MHGQPLYNVITFPCLWYLLLAHKSATARLCSAITHFPCNLTSTMSHNDAATKKYRASCKGNLWYNKIVLSLASHFIKPQIKIILTKVDSMKLKLDLIKLYYHFPKMWSLLFLNSLDVLIIFNTLCQIYSFGNKSCCQNITCNIFWRVKP